MYDVIVLGAGIIGASTAYELAKKGQRVLLLEKRELGTGASGRSAAMLESQVDAHRGEPFFTLARQSHALFPSLSLDVKNLTGIDFQLDPCGVLEVAFNEEEAMTLKEEVHRQKELGLKVDWLTSSDILKNHPQINSHVLGGAFFREDGQVDGLLFTQAMLKAAEKKGVQIIPNLGSIKIEADEADESTVSVVTHQKGTFTAPHLVVAAGAWTDSLLESLDVRLGIEPIRGQLLVYDTPERPLPFILYNRSQGYITPKNGITLVGSTMEAAGFDESTTEDAKAKLVSQAKDLLPSLVQSPLKTMTAGLRPGSPDGLPLIGPLLDYPQIFIATGHLRNGMLLAPITAKLITEMITDPSSAINLNPFTPNRFLVEA